VLLRLLNSARSHTSATAVPGHCQLGKSCGS